MSSDAWITLIILAGTIFVLARDLFAPAITLLASVIALLVTGVLTPEQAFAGFGNPAPITVAALYVLAGAVEKTGTLQPVVRWMLDGNRGRRRMLARLVIPTAGASSFLNNTPIVAMLAPQVAAWADRRGISPSRFLMPLSFASILGGMVTLIGTSTNVVVSGLLHASGQAPLGMFELTPIGLPAAAIGILTLLVFTPWLLPDRRAARQQAAAEFREFVVNMRVVAGGPLEGVTVEGGGLRSLSGVFLAELERDRELIVPVSPLTQLRGGDRLTFVGRADMVVDLHRVPGLVSTERDHMLFFDSPDHTFFEVVVGENSPLAGRTLKEANFRETYQAAVLAIHRAGRRVDSKLGAVRLKVGDTLILLSDRGFRERWSERNHFLLVARMGGTPPTSSRKAGLVAAIGLGIVVAAATGLVPILQAALLGAIGLLVLKVLTPGEARAAVDLNVLVVIGASFGLGAAMDGSGLAASLAHGMVELLGDTGRVGAIAGIMLATLVLTEMITNNAAAVLIFPIAMAMSADLGLDPRMMAVGVAVTASASFLTPIGYQTNTMVYGLGGYKFSDFVRVGGVLTIAVTATVILLLTFVH